MFFFDSKPANSGQDGKLRGRRWLRRESAMHVRLGLEVQGHRLYISAASEEGNRDASRHAWSRDLVIASWEQVSFCSLRFFECRLAGYKCISFQRVHSAWTLRSFPCTVLFDGGQKPEEEIRSRGTSEWTILFNILNLFCVQDCEQEAEGR